VINPYQKMKQKIYQVDAFTDKVFSGNPAAVCPLDTWLSDGIMQSITLENNLAETAFCVKHDNQFQIRWFTPAIEVDLCGHATLAAAFVLFNYENYQSDTIHFFSPRSGAKSQFNEVKKNVILNYDNY
jgi:PhzF family phenazine biosynthesis protein